MLGISTVASALFIVALPSQELRPWEAKGDAGALLLERARQASTSEQRLQLAERALRESRFTIAHRLLLELVREEPDHAAARSLLGHRIVDGEWKLDDTNFESERPAVRLNLEDLPDRDKTRVLAAFDDAPSSSGRSSYFDLRTDLDPAAAGFYGKVLDRHFRRLKTRFKAYTGESIDVLVFAKRSDYLRYYMQAVGKSGEHVSGFYYHDHLVFFDDPGDREQVRNTATHECTHLLIDRLYRRAPLPIWLHEGMACYLAGEAEELRGQYTAGLYMKVIEGLSNDQVIGLEDLLDAAKDGFDHTGYAFAWSWFHFLNQRPTAARFQKFFSALLEADLAKSTKSDCRKRTRRLLLEALDLHPEQLSERWAKYFREDFELETPEQYADFADHCLSERVYNPKADRERTLDMASVALDAIPDSADDETVTRRDLLRVWRSVRRLYEIRGDLDVALLALRSIRDGIRALPAGVARSEVAELATRALIALQKRVPGSSKDIAGREELVALGRSHSVELARALVVLHDELLAEAHKAFNDVFESAPVARKSVHNLLYLCLEVTPEELEPLFRRLQLLVEADPDDENLAAFAAAYAAMGDVEYAKHLLEEARRRSLNPDGLQSFARYVE